MTEVRFYHLTRSPLEQALPGILEKVVERGWRAVVQAGSPERVRALSQHLWTFRPDSFLPHGTAEDGDAELQPVYLTDRPDSPNQATVLVLTDGAVREVAGFEMCCDMFDGNDPEAVDAARTRWRRLKEAGHKLTYWQQTPQGWDKKAEG